MVCSGAALHDLKLLLTSQQVCKVIDVSHDHQDHILITANGTAVKAWDCHKNMTGVHDEDSMYMHLIVFQWYQK